MAYLLPRTVSHVLIAILIFHGFCAGEMPPDFSFMHDATKAPKISFYDYIVIGGGTSGIPLATTLSENYSVLLLERGGSPYVDPNITDIKNFGSYLLDTSPSSPAQHFITEGVQNARPRVLGGGTSVNAGFYSRGESKFNNEASLMDESLIRKSYEWIEKVMVFKPENPKWQRALHAGLVEAGVTPDNGFSYDHIIGTKLAGSLFDENGTRHTSADLLQYANPRGLTVFLHATVGKILFRIRFGRSRPLVFEDSRKNKHMVFLKGREKDEIILSAGALGSPQLLMLSGIGPKEQLDAHKIGMVLEQPFVGKGMADNPLNVIFIPSPIPVEPSIVQVVGISRFGSYIEGTGAYDLILADTSAYQGFSPKMGGFIIEKTDGPLSRGELRIKNLNPADNPSVTFNYFKEPEDLQKCVNGIKTILKAVESKAFSNYK